MCFRWWLVEVSEWNFFYSFWGSLIFWPDHSNTVRREWWYSHSHRILQKQLELVEQIEWSCFSVRKKWRKNEQWKHFSLFSLNSLVWFVNLSSFNYEKVWLMSIRNVNFLLSVVKWVLTLQLDNIMEFMQKPIFNWNETKVYFFYILWNSVQLKRRR